MNTAILISGQTRTFGSVWKNQWWYVLRHYKDAHVFASVSDDEDADQIQRLTEHFPDSHVFVEKVAQPDCLALLNIDAEKVNDLPHGAAMTPSSDAQAILRQLWHLNRAWEFCGKAAPAEARYNQYMRLRPDIHFHRFVKPPRLTGFVCYSPWWGTYGGINDRLAIMGDQAAVSYFTAFAAVPKLLEAGCPLHPETLLAGALELGGVVSHRRLEAEFSAVRPGSGQLIWPDMQLYDVARPA